MFYKTKDTYDKRVEVGFYAKDNGTVCFYFPNYSGMVSGFSVGKLLHKKQRRIVGIMPDEQAFDIWRKKFFKPRNIEELVLREVYSYNLELFISHINTYGKYAASISLAQNKIDNVKSRYAIHFHSSKGGPTWMSLKKEDNIILDENGKLPMSCILVPEELSVATQIIDLQKKHNKLECEFELKKMEFRLKDLENK